MLLRILMAGVLVLSINLTLIGQENPRTRKAYSSPPSVAVLLAAQPDCPLRLENARFVQSEDNSRWGATYVAHNAGSRPIRSFSTLIVTSFGTGGSLGHFDSAVTGVLMPGQTFDQTNDKSSVSAGSLSKPDLHGARIRLIAVLVVGKIVFSDGSTYDGEPAFKALQDYFQELDLQAKP